MRWIFQNILQQICHQWGRNEFYPGEDSKIFLYLEEDQNQFFRNFITFSIKKSSDPPRFRPHCTILEKFTKQRYIFKGYNYIFFVNFNIILWKKKYWWYIMIIVIFESTYHNYLYDKILNLFFIFNNRILIVV